MTTLTLSEPLEAGEYDVTKKGETPPEPPPTGDCHCEMKVGTVTTLEPGQPATVTMEEDAEGVYTLNYGIPKGEQGIPGPPGSGTSGPGTCKLGAGNVSLKDVAPNAGDGNTDAAVSIMQAWDMIKGTGGKIWIDIPNNIYNVKQPIKIYPAAGQAQLWCSIECVGGHAGKGFRYTGPSSTASQDGNNNFDAAVFDFKGNNNGVIRGLRIGIDSGKKNVACVQFRTDMQSQSTKNVKVFDVYFTLGAGPNQGFKFIKTAPNALETGDISLMNFDTYAIYGGAMFSPVPGAYAFQSKNPNCLAMNAYGGFTESLDSIFCNWAFERENPNNPTQKWPALDNERGGATWTFKDSHTSHNICNYRIDREGTLDVENARYEVDQMILQTRGGNHPSNVTFKSIRADHMLGGNLFQLNGAITLKLDNCQMHKADPAFNELIYLNTNSHNSIIIDGGTYRYNQLIRRQPGTATNTRVYMRGATKFAAGQYANGIEGPLADINGQSM